eukprot:gene6293-12738_t
MYSWLSTNVGNITKKINPETIRKSDDNYNQSEYFYGSPHDHHDICCRGHVYGVTHIDTETILKQENPFSHFIAGVAAGIAEWFVGHPLDTVRVRIMAQPTGGVPSASMGTMSQLAVAFRSWEGMTALYRGSTSELMASALGGSLLFGVNNILRKLLAVGPHEEGVSSGLLLAAAGTGIFDSTVYKPLEIIKLRQQVSTTNASFIASTRELLAEDGIRGMYRGLLPTVIREGIGSAAFFAAYELSKAELCKLAGVHRKDASGNIILLSGGIAGFTYVMVAHPFETAAVLIQLDSYKKPKYLGLVDVFKQVTHKAGFFGLYRGVSPTLARAFPAYAASFYGYEWALKAMDPNLNKKKGWDDLHPNILISNSKNN